MPPLNSITALVRPRLLFQPAFRAISEPHLSKELHRDTIKPSFNAIVFAIKIDEPPHKWCITECSLAHLVMHHAVDIDTPAGKMPEFFARGNAIWRPSMHGATKIKVFDTENEADYAALMLHFDQMSYTYCMYEPFYYESQGRSRSFHRSKAI
jgi:hypothetical protein